MNLSNPSELKALLKSHGFSFSKSLGQNFLIDESVLEKIVTASGVSKDSCVLEIGAGAGVLSRRLAKTGAKCVSVEIDKALLPILNETMADFDNFSLINEDILNVDLNALWENYFEKKPFFVVANLPYYITTPIIMKLFESRLPVVSMTLMVQKEVAERICASPGGKDYGALTVAVGYFSKPETVCTAEPHCFIPNPKVASTVINLKALNPPAVKADNEAEFFSVVKSAFGQRRKTLVNALSKSPYISFEKENIIKCLEKMELPETIRGEKLSIEQFAMLSNLLNNMR